MTSNFNLINWQFLLFSSLWIIGFSLILAGLSFHYWLSIETNQKFWNILKGGPFQRLLWSGISLVTVGFAGSNANSFGWEFIAWGILGIASLFQLVMILREE